MKEDTITKAREIKEDVTKDGKIYIFLQEKIGEE